MGRKESRRAQQRRRRRNNSGVELQSEPFLMIDGNETYRPYGYCSRYEGYVSKNMSLVHRCEEINCHRFSKLSELSTSTNTSTKGDEEK